MAVDDQAVSGESTRDLVLLGAGASVEAGVPATVESTERLVAAIDESSPALGRVLRFVCGALIGYDAAAGASPFDGLDVERVFTAIGLLAKRRDLEVSPFVSAWHRSVEALDPPVERMEVIDRLVELVIPEPPRREEIEPQYGGGSFLVFPSGRELQEKAWDARWLLRALVDGADSGNGDAYVELSRRMVAALRALMTFDADRVDHLLPLVEAARRPGGLTVATLNYDRTIEAACERAGVPLHTGIGEWGASRRWGWPQEGMRLLKLHGSIDWEWRHVVEHGHLPQRALEQVGPEGSEQPALLFGGRDKLTAEGPFLSLLAEFERFLRTADRLVVVGYSFRDDHVNELIRQWTGPGPERTIVVVDPYWPDGLRHQEPSEDFRQQLETHLDVEGVRRLTLLPLPASEGLSRLYGERSREPGPVAESSDRIER